MKPTDVRNANWEAIRGQLAGGRERVWRALFAGGPQTTRKLAARMEEDLLWVRPRVSELVTLGFAALVGVKNKEGVYAAVSILDAREIFWKRHEEAGIKQQELGL